MAFLFVYLLWANWRLTLVMVAVLPVIALLVGSASRKFRRQARKIQVAMGDVTHVASETIQGHRVVRGFGGEAYEQARFTAPIRAKYEEEGSPYYATARLWDDGIIDPAETRDVLGLALVTVANEPIPATRVGVYRM